MDRDLVKTHPDVQHLLAPERRPAQRRIRNLREALIARRASRTEQLEKLAHPAGARTSELWLGRRQAVARKKTGRNLDGVALDACSRVVHLRCVSDLDGDGVPQDVTEGPVAVAGVVEKAVFAPDKGPYQIAVSSLREVEDARNLGPRR